MLFNKNIAVEKLIKLGFSDKEGEIYVNLLEHPNSNGSQISKRLGYPRSTIYPILLKLQKEGYIYSVPDKKTTSYLALNLKDVLSRLMQDLNEAGEILEKELKKINIIPYESNFLNINSERGLEKTICHILENTQNEIYIESSIDLKKFKKISTLLTRLKKRGIKVRGSLGHNLNELQGKTLFKNLEPINKYENIVLLSDYKSVVIAGKDSNNQFKGTFSENIVLINLIDNYINN